MQDDLTEVELQALASEERASVQKLLLTYTRRQEKLAAERERSRQMQLFEKQLRAQGTTLIAGIDEAGRGPLAGPVVAAAVILPVDFYSLELKDSKQLSAKKRTELRQIICDEALAIGIGIVTETEIDQLNIYRATIKAMELAVHKLPQQAQHLLIDAMKLPDIHTEQTKIIKGDQRSYSIAAASIIAKTTRDTLMHQAAEAYPQYGFERHMGYSTPEHLRKLQQFGPCPLHRRSFAPVKTHS